MNRLAILFIVGVMAALGPGVSAQQDDDPRNYRGLSAAEIRALRERVEQTVREPGSATVRSGYVASPIQGTILWMIEEGTKVSKGDFLARLDDSELQDLLAQQEIVLA